MTFIPEKINLVYIEDNKESARVIVEILKKSNHIKFNIAIKSTLKDGLDFLAKECSDVESCNVDVILLDLMLPNSQGVDTYIKVREVCNFLPVVIISGHEDIACECVKMGAQDFLIKPVDKGILTRSLKYAIERKKLLKQLKIREEHYRDLIEATNASIYEIDFINNKFTYVNDVMCKKTGYTREELMAMGPTDMLTDESIQKWIDRWEGLNKGEYIEKTFEYEATVKDGSKVWTLITAEYKEDRDKKIIGARVVAIDITEAKVARQEAKRKEEMIFNQLEERIHQWREEITESTILQQNKVLAISLEVDSITNGIEVS